MDDFVTVAEAAAALGVTEDAVRKLLHAERLEGRRRGRAWLIDRRSLEALARQRPSRGRPLSSPVCWGAILAWSHLEPASDDPPASLAYTRGADWLSRNDVVTRSFALRSRGVAEHFRAHPSAVQRLTSDPTHLRGGPPAAGLATLVGAADVTVHELYAPASHREQMVTAYGLLEGRGNLLVRWVDDEVWGWVAAAARRAANPVGSGVGAPRCAALLDCLEDDDPRVRRVAREALRQGG